MLTHTMPSLADATNWRRVEAYVRGTVGRTCLLSVCGMYMFDNDAQQPMRNNLPAAHQDLYSAISLNDTQN